MVGFYPLGLYSSGLAAKDANFDLLIPVQTNFIGLTRVSKTSLPRLDQPFNGPLVVVTSRRRDVVTLAIFF
jgi:hypothetical protein